jgi:hypothetical protein
MCLSLSIISRITTMLVISFHVVILLPFTTTSSLHDVVMPLFVLLKLILPSHLLHFVSQGVEFEVVIGDN